MSRIIKYSQALNEAVDLCLAKDPAVYIMGLGVPDPLGVFGSTLGLQEKYGDKRVMDMPTAENAMTGIAIGTALAGMRPVMTHQRIDFALLAMEQLVNQAANWHYMFGGKMKVPLVVRLIIGRGWGQGPQHSQSLQSWFSHIPGLKVVMPVTPYDAKGLLISSIEDDNPVVFIEHRWLYDIEGDVPEAVYRIPLGKSKLVREGRDLTIAATSYMTLEAIKAADLLAKKNIGVDVIDIRTLKPLDKDLILKSVRKTGRLITVDLGWKTAGYAAEIISCIVEEAMTSLKSSPKRITLPDCPTPTSPALAKFYYPRAVHILREVGKMLGIDVSDLEPAANANIPLDVPDKSFKGPF